MAQASAATGWGCSKKSGSAERMMPSMSRNSVTRPWITAVNRTPGRLERRAGDERLLDDVEDAADDQPDAPALAGVDDDLDRLVVAGLPGRARACRDASRPFRSECAPPPQRPRHVDQRQDLVAVLNHVLRADPFQGRAREFLQPGHQRQRDGHAAAVVRGEQEHGLAVAGRLGARWPPSRSARARALRR